MFRLYIHGGRDLKEGALNNMWRLDLDSMQELIRDNNYPVEWESVSMSGDGPGKISHHTTDANATTMILYGG
jgi:hypothetical protein